MATTKRQRVVWHLEVPQRLNEMLEEFIEREAYKTKSEFIRVAVRDRLEEEMRKLDGFLGVSGRRVNQHELRKAGG